MKKKTMEIIVNITKDYINGMKYKDIMKKYGANRWDIEDALSKLNIKTNRIKSHPRLPGNKKVVSGLTLIEHHDIDLLPPMKPKENNPVLNEDDLDYMERYNLETDDTGEQGSYEMVIDENGKVRYEENVH